MLHPIGVGGACRLRRTIVHVHLTPSRRRGWALAGASVSAVPHSDCRIRLRRLRAVIPDQKDC
ncbi:hypothetical protein XHV734_0149 [Xanthomonas hortorum pv. vitians]|nr:hypothetical protein XHV734_0149 [Xanthomonas hortorum pv. vitians]